MTTFFHGTLFTFNWPTSPLSIRQLWENGQKRHAYWKLCPTKHPVCILAYQDLCHGVTMPLLNSDATPISKEDFQKVIRSMNVFS